MPIEIHTTLGPASSKDCIIEELLQVGTDVFRRYPPGQKSELQDRTRRTRFHHTSKSLLQSQESSHTRAMIGIES